MTITRVREVAVRDKEVSSVTVALKISYLKKIGYWHFLEDTFQELATAYGYQEIRIPIIEETELFRRSIGEVTDIVEKEMYTFVDNDGNEYYFKTRGYRGCCTCVHGT